MRLQPVSLDKRASLRNANDSPTRLSGRTRTTLRSTGEPRYLHPATALTLADPMNYSQVLVYARLEEDHKVEAWDAPRAGRLIHTQSRRRYKAQLARSLSDLELITSRAFIMSHDCTRMFDGGEKGLLLRWEWGTTVTDPRSSPGRVRCSCRTATLSLDHSNRHSDVPEY